MNWKTLDRTEQLDEIITSSQQKPQAIFKHSTRCYISKAVMKNLESEWNISDEKLDVFYLDLLQHRNISSEIAARFSVVHQSPQMIVISKGKVIYQDSHQSISLDEMNDAINAPLPTYKTIDCSISTTGQI